MQIKDILKQAVLFLGLEDLLKTTALSGETTPTTSEYKILNLLLACTNCVIDEIASDYFPLLIEEEVVPNGDCKIEYSSLSKAVHTIKSLKDIMGNTVKFIEFPKYLKVDYPYNCQIVYTYLPTRATAFDNEVDVVDTRVTIRLIALGVACEYCYLTLRNDQAESFDKRYKDALLSVYSKPSEICLKARRWN